MIFENEDKYKDNIGVYQIKNLINSKVYIGQSKEKFERRYWHHQWLLRHGKHHNLDLQTEWNQYGEDEFVFQVLQVAESEIQCDELEKKYISLFNATSPEYGYNKLSGSDFDSNEIKSFRLPESFKKVGELNRQRMLGTTLSDETKAKMSEQHKGSKNSQSKLTEDDVRKIRSMIANGYTYSQIAELFNVTRANVRMIATYKTWKHI